MVCKNPKTIYIRNKYPIHPKNEKDIKRLNKPSLNYREDWTPVQVPCGECEMCKIEKSNQYATRISNEMEIWDGKGVFVTLSYNNQNLPKNNGINTLKRKDLVDFKKRLRKYIKKHNQAIKEWINPYTGKKEKPIRTFECGEYGMNGTRAKDGGNPHYHILIMNWMPNDLEFDKYSKKTNEKLFKSKTLSEIWGKGHAPIGMITYESASYVARYTTKKSGLAKVEREYYDAIEWNEETKSWDMVTKYRNKKGIQEPEFIGMSQGIGRKWFIENIDKVKEQSCILVKTKSGVKQKGIPRYYRKVWQQINWLEYEHWKYSRKKQIEEDIKKEIKKYNLPNDWNEYKKITFINDNKIKNWIARRKTLFDRNNIA